MAQTTFRKIAEQIIKAHYNRFPTPEASITLRMVAERAAMLIAKAAFASAYGNSNAGEATYANDQFICVFYNCPLLTDGVTGDKYSVMPATPAGLPAGREIAQISFAGAPNVWCVPMKNYADFIETLLPERNDPFVLFKVENGNIVFRNLPSIINSPVNMKLVGAVPMGVTLLDSNLNCPKDTEDYIYTTILNQLAMEYKVPVNNISTGEPN